MPVTVLQYVPELQDARRKEAEDDHHGKPEVEPPKPNLQELLYPRPQRITRDLAQHVRHKADAQHAEHADERGMAVIDREDCPDFVVAHDRRVDEEAEDASAEEVPESDRHQEEEGPAVPEARGALAACEPVEIPCVER